MKTLLYMALLYSFAASCSSDEAGKSSENQDANLTWYYTTNQCTGVGTSLTCTYDLVAAEDNENRYTCRTKPAAKTCSQVSWSFVQDQCNKVTSYQSSNAVQSLDQMCSLGLK